MIEEDGTCSKHLQKRIQLVTYLSMSKLMGFWSLLRQSKFEGLTLWKCKSRGGGYCVSYGRPLKMSSRTRVYGGYIC